MNVSDLSLARRANSAQSLRIRTLEGEVSRLLAENVSLREQVIKLREIENSVSNIDAEQIDSFKKKLENKLQEVGGIVEEFEKVRLESKRRSQKRQKSIERSSPRRSPNQRNWKNALTLSEVTGEDDGRLPPILEDKFYPRQTLEYAQAAYVLLVHELTDCNSSRDLHGILSDPGNVTDSPELGPPPVAHFEEPEQIRAMDIGEDDLPSTIGRVNLESRRRRRESSHQKDGRAALIFEDIDTNSATASTDTDHARFSSGAKRKLNMRESEDNEAFSTVKEKGEFEFSRKKTGSSPSVQLENSNIVSSKAEVRKAQTSSDQRSFVTGSRQKDKSGEDSSSEMKRNPTGGRKVLGPSKWKKFGKDYAWKSNVIIVAESINTDPQSPAKIERTSLKDKISDMKERSGGKADSANEKFLPIKQSSRSRTNRSSLSNGKASDRPASSTKVEASVKEEILDAANRVATNHKNPPGSGEPGTPLSHPLDLLSPAEPSSVPLNEFEHVGVGRGDTPPPPDLSGSSSSFGRASRRLRGSVSYAEPNLRDKMRRPGKAMVDAVVLSAKSFEGSQGRPGDGILTLDANGAPNIKREDGEMDGVNISGPGWKEVQVKSVGQPQRRERANITSPLGKKPPILRDTASLTSPTRPARDGVHRPRTGSASIVTPVEYEYERDDRLLIPTKDHSTGLKERSSSSSAISALMTTQRNKSSKRPLESQHEEKIHTRSKETSSDADERARIAGDSIFDFTGSPPPSPQSPSSTSSVQSGSQTTSKNGISTQRSSSRRRHSSAVTSTSLSARLAESEAGGGPAAEAKTERNAAPAWPPSSTTGSLTTSRRRAGSTSASNRAPSTDGEGKTSASESGTGSRNGSRSGSGSGRTIKSAKSTVTLGREAVDGSHDSGDEEGTRSTTTETDTAGRVASRRRSMML